MTRNIGLFRHRHGRKGGCRNRLHAKVMAKKQFKQEFFMSHRKMRIYWAEPKASLYGPLRLMSRWMRWNKIKHKMKR